ncbi:MAG: hypothetical protein ACO3LD_02350, partial [Luminiphilus sp.]
IICDLVIFSFTAFIFDGAFGVAFLAIELTPLSMDGFVRDKRQPAVGEIQHQSDARNNPSLDCFYRYF